MPFVCAYSPILCPSKKLYLLYYPIHLGLWDIQVYGMLLVPQLWRVVNKIIYKSMGLNLLRQGCSLCSYRSDYSNNSKYGSSNQTNHSFSSLEDILKYIMCNVGFCSQGSVRFTDSQIAVSWYIIIIDWCLLCLLTQWCKWKFVHWIWYIWELELKETCISFPTESTWGAKT